MGRWAKIISVLTLLGVLAPAAGQEVERTGAPAVAGVDLQGTPVTLQLQNALPEDIYGRLGRQMNLRFGGLPGSVIWDRPELQRPLTVDLNGVAFWEAMDRLSGLTGLVPLSDPNDRSKDGRVRAFALEARREATDRRPSCLVGPFLVHVENIVTSRNAVYDGTAAAAPRCLVLMTVLAEPGLPLISFADSSIRTSGVDDAGGTMTMENGTQTVSLSPNTRRTWFWNVTASLNPAGKKSQHIARMGTTLVAALGGKIEAWEVADAFKAADVKKTAGGLEFTLKSVRPAAQPMAAFPPAATPGQSIVRQECDAEVEVNARTVEERNYVDYLRLAQLVDADGQVWQASSMSWTSPGGNSPMLCQVRFYGPSTRGTAQSLKEPVKLVVPFPAEIRRVEIPVEFKDLPLR